MGNIQRRCIFIGGCDRSGTTLLQNMLNNHPDLLVTYEMGAAIKLHGEFARLTPATVPQFAAKLSSLRDFRGLTPESISDLAGSHASFADVLSAAYTLLANQKGKRIWGDKSPRYVNHFCFLATMFPEAKLIHIYRDPRAITHSILSKPWGPNTAYHSAQYWHATVSSGLLSCRVLPKETFLNIRYEDLVGDPEALSKHICAFLEIPFSPEMLASRRDEDVVPRASQSHHPHVGDRIDTRQVDKWHALPARDIRTIEAICGRLMDELGYKQECGTDGRGVGFAWRSWYGVLSRLKKAARYIRRR